jgi:uncharacterized protein (DUF608 family)
LNLLSTGQSSQSKFCAPVQGYFFNIKLSSPLNVIGFGFRSANDSSQKDPKYFKVSLTKNQGKEVILKYENEKPFSARHQLWNYVFDAPHSIVQIKVEVESTHQEGAQDTAQLGEFLLYEQDVIDEGWKTCPF